MNFHWKVILPEQWNVFCKVNLSALYRCTQKKTTGPVYKFFVLVEEANFFKLCIMGKYQHKNIIYIILISPTLFILKILFIYFYREEKGGRKRETDMRETLIGCLSYAPWLGTEPATQACALTGNPTCDPLLCRTTPNQLSHTTQGYIINFNSY